MLDDGSSGADAHNDYPRLWAQTNFDALMQARPSGDFVTFNRSGSAGISARTSVHWLGDQLTSFDRNDGLGSVLPLYLSAGMSGIALTHSDVGGYTSDGSSLVRDQELWTRWLELEAFTPILRTHHGSAPTKNVQWNTDDVTRALFDRYARWYQRLLPYFARLAEEAHASGAPAVRPIWFEDEDPALFASDQEAFVGSDLLIAPIIEQGARLRDVMLPAGTWRRWRSFEAALEAALRGRVSADAALEEPIVFVRAGAVIPLLADDHPSLSGATALPPLALFAATGGSSDGMFHGMHWSFTAPEVFTAECAQEITLSGSALAGEPTLLSCGDKTATLRLDAPGIDSLKLRVD